MTRSSIACVLALLAATSLQAQTGPAQVAPLTDAIPVAVGETPSHHLLNPEVAVLGQKEFLVTWDLDYRRYSGSSVVDFGTAISGRKVSLQGQPAGDELILEPFEQRSIEGYHRMAADAAGRFATLWNELDSSEFLLRLFNPDGTVLETTRLDGNPGGFVYPYFQVVAMDPSGRLSAAWSQTPEVRLQLFDSSAAPTGDPLRFQSSPFGTQPALAMARGNAIIAYQASVQNRPVLVVARFDAAGRPLGPRTPVVGENSSQGDQAVAANADGRFVVAWVDNQGVGARIFGPSGEKVGPVIRVTASRNNSQPDVAVDARGNFVVIWHANTVTSGDRAELRARVFNRDGVPQGREILIAPEFYKYYYLFPSSVALTDAGTFLATWASEFEENLDGPAIQGRLYRLLRDDDRCVWRDGTFLCDTAYDGDPTHQEVRFGASGDHPLLADFDGDGIDNPCVRRGNAFRCARPGSSDLVLRFGRSDNIPLAGDLDGDGDDDPCVRRGRSFLCDTAHNGGLPEVNIPLGTDSDEPTLGDLDGDGDDDPCIWRPSTGTFLCDATHDGAPDLAHSVDTQPGDHPLLGDVDGDGRVDFCFARDEDLFCDLDRDGVLTEETLATEPGDVLLLGNVDGV